MLLYTEYAIEIVRSFDNKGAYMLGLNLYRGKHLLSAKSFGLVDHTGIFRDTEQMQEYLVNPADRRALKQLLVRDGEPLEFELHMDISNRTVTSFRVSIRNMGGHATWMPVEFSSRAKGESSWSMARIVGPHCACIIVRDDKDKNAAHAWADGIEYEGLDVPVINAGCGNGEHPTQTLVDLYPLWKFRERELLTGQLKIALVGDLSGSRTIHSLLHGISCFGATIYLVAFEEESIPDEIMDELDMSKLTFHRITSVDEMLDIAPEIDFWYWTRWQGNLRDAPDDVKKKQERRYAHEFGVTEALRQRMNPCAFAIHPLPFGLEYQLENQYGPDIMDSRFIHFWQAQMGVPIRMALLQEMFAKNIDIPTIRFRNETTRIFIGTTAIEIPNRIVSEICATCLNIRLERNQWGGPRFISEADKETFGGKIPYSFCTDCRPK